MIHLSPRLRLAAVMTRPGMPVTDIGTDHAYLPVALIQQGRIPWAVATDINEGPLKNAEETLKRYAPDCHIELVQSDGFLGLTPDHTLDYTICGMGGNLMSTMLEAADWVKNPDYHFVFQPQSHAEDLRDYLYRHGFSILREYVVTDDRRLALAMEVTYTGEAFQPTLKETHLGKLAEVHTPERDLYFQKLLNRLASHRDSILQVPGMQEQVRLLSQLIQDIQEATANDNRKTNL